MTAELISIKHEWNSDCETDEADSIYSHETINVTSYLQQLRTNRRKARKVVRYQTCIPYVKTRATQYYLKIYQQNAM